MVEVGGDALGPDRDGAAEFLQPDLTPVLAQWSRQELEMAEDSKPFIHVEFDILFNCGPQKPSAPPAAFTMRDRSADGSSGIEEEEVDMRIDL
jgi:hypothetical protein